MVAAGSGVKPLRSANGPSRHDGIGTNLRRYRPCWGQADKKAGDAGMAGLKSALAVAVALLSGAASAQQVPMSEDLAWKLLELGRVIDPPKTAAIYAPMQEKEPYKGVRIER